MELGNIVFMSIPKTGSSSIQASLGRYSTNKELPDNMKIRPYDHFKWDDISNNFSGEKVYFSIIREPYDWYVSYYFHQYFFEHFVKEQKGIAVDYSSNNIINDFRSWVINNKGYYTNLIKKILPPECEIIKFENMEELNVFFKKQQTEYVFDTSIKKNTLIDFLKNMYYNVPEEINKEDFYNDEIRNIIKENDTEIFFRYDYKIE